ncbi:hypothetical protein C8R46DRAFT_1041170 [Mycena filopes]|nr:hypothetical protein C8R46DRAFT_1041170 [Mycena filopes]
MSNSDAPRKYTLLPYGTYYSTDQGNIRHIVAVDVATVTLSPQDSKLSDRSNHLKPMEVVEEFIHGMNLLHRKGMWIPRTGQIWYHFDGHVNRLCIQALKVGRQPQLNKLVEESSDIYRMFIDHGKQLYRSEEQARKARTVLGVNMQETIKIVWEYMHKVQNGDSSDKLKEELSINLKTELKRVQTQELGLSKDDRKAVREAVRLAELLKRYKTLLANP